MGATPKRTAAPRAEAVAKWRFYLALTVLSVMATALIWRVASLQVLTGESRGFEFLQGQGAARSVRTESISAYRGVITDRYGEPLAVSTPVDSLWAEPDELLDAPQSWLKLASALSMPEAELAAKLQRYKGKDFMYLKRHLAPEVASNILALNVPGVYSQREYRRFYPAAEVAAHVVGLTDIDDRGQEGMELAYDQWLAGANGRKQVIKDLKGRVVKEVRLIKAAESGNNLRLSLDLRLQTLVHQELKKAVLEHGAKSGSVVVLDTQTGEVLAMANQPSYNPNDRSSVSGEALRNRALTDQFEPGSPMKALTVLAGLESGKWRPQTKIDTSPGHIRVGRKTLIDPVNYGVVDVTKVLTKSSQVGTTKIALSMEPETLRDMFHRFGFGEATGTGFPGERIGELPSRTRWKPIQQANMAFGYGMTVTVLQLAQAYNILAAGGELRPVSLLKHEQLPEPQRLVEQKYVKELVAMLKTVVEPGGTATKAALGNYTAAGKTGTAHKVGREGYEDDRYVAVFAGMAPAENPRFVCAVMINEPSNGKYFGGEVAAPLFGAIAKQALPLLGVAPNEKLHKAQVKKSLARREKEQQVLSVR